MSNVLPENISNFSKDFLFQRELYVGLGANQFNVRTRIAAAEQLVSQLQGNQSSTGTAVTNLTTRVSTLETNQTRISNDLAGTLNSLAILSGKFDGHADDTLLHVSDTLRNHPANSAVHVPAGGFADEVLATGASGLVWKTVMSLLPENLQAIIDNGGNVTPEQVIEAFRQITVSVWESGGLPLGADRITSSVFAGDRFFVGGQSGRVNYTFDASTWQKAVGLFTEPSPAVSVESIAYAKTSNDETLLVALDAYSDLRISMDRATWCPRLSVRVTTNPDGTYTDRYETADFTCAVADRGLFLLFTSKGTVYRATYDDVIAEFERAMEAQGPTGEVSGTFDRHSVVWQMQLSQESITAGVLSATSGGGHYVTVGTLGRIAVSNAAVQWSAVSGPFGSTNINSVSVGPDKFVAVGDDGKAGYAPLSDPTRWTLLTGTPFGTEKLTCVTYGGGLWVVVSGTGKTWSSSNGISWKEVPANMVFGGTTVSFGDTYFIIGDTNGNVVRSMSVAAIFSVVTRAEFAALAQQITNATEEQIEKMWQQWLLLKQDVEDALAKQLVIGTTPGLPSIAGGSAGTTETPVLDNDGEPVLDGDGNPVTVPQTKTSAYDHRHDQVNEVLQAQLGKPTYKDWVDVPANSGIDPNHMTGVPRWQDAVYLTQLDRASYPANADDWYGRFHRHGIPILDYNGLIYAKNQTWQRGQANGIAPLDENTLVPAEYLADGWGYVTLIRALRDQMLIYWNLLRNNIFQDSGEASRINAFAYDETTIVAVGESGKIAWGPHLEQLQMVAEMPFGLDDSVMGVAKGTRGDGINIFIVVTDTQYSTSLNGSDWTEAVDLSEGLQGVFFGGGYFLIPDQDGNIWRSDWDEFNNLSFLKQETTPNITRGVMSIAYLQSTFIGVGAGNVIVKATDPAYWIEEQSPLEADTQLNSVCAGDGIIVAVGSKGRCITRDLDGNWTVRNTGTTVDLHFVTFESFTYLAAGKNGTLKTSFNATSWVSRNSKTTATIRAGGYKNERFFIGTDAGQLVASASVYDVLTMGDEDNTAGPSNDDPEPLADPPFPGIKNTYSRSDHVHPLQDMPEPAGDDDVPQHDIVDGATGESDLFARADHRHPLQVTDNNPVALAENAASGNAENYSREDHVHPYTGLIPQSEKGVPNGVAPLDGDNLVPKVHIPPINLDDLLNALKANLEFGQVQSPFQRGLGATAVLHAGCAIDGILALCGESGIGYSNGGAVWQMVEDQPFDEAVIGMAAGLDHDNKMIAFAVDTKKSYSSSRNLILWNEKTTVDGNYDFSWISYYNKTFVITSTNGQILRSVWNGTGYDFAEQEDGPEFTEGIVRVVGGNGHWIGIGTNGRLWWSTDASHFTPIETPVEGVDLYAVDYANGLFVAGGEGGVMIAGDKDGFSTINKPFDNGEDIMSVTFIASMGLLMVTNRIGEIAVTDSVRNMWIKILSPMAVAIRAVAQTDKIISIGSDNGEIASSRKVIEINISGVGGGNVALAALIEVNEDGTGDYRLLDANGDPTGEIHSNLPVVSSEQEPEDGIAIVASEDLVRGLVNIHNVDGTAMVRQADATNAERYATGFVRSDVQIGETANVLFSGIAEQDETLPDDVKLYLSTGGQAGNYDDSASVMQVVGYRTGANSYLFVQNEEIKIR